MQWSYLDKVPLIFLIAMTMLKSGGHAYSPKAVTGKSPVSIWKKLSLIN